MQTATMNNEQKVPVSISPSTPKGKPAQLDGPPKWSVISGDVTLDVAADGLSGHIISGDNPGQAQVLIEADAHPDPAVEQMISDIVEVTVNGALAANMGLSIGTPVDK